MPSIIGNPPLLSTAFGTIQDCITPTSRIFFFDAFDKALYKGLRSWKVLMQHVDVTRFTPKGLSAANSYRHSGIH